MSAGGRKPLHCRGCGRLVGYGYFTKVDVRCTDLSCHQLPVPNGQDARDDVIRYLYSRGETATELGRIFELTRQRIEQIARDLQGSTG